jgi:hypothetical protein
MDSKFCAQLFVIAGFTRIHAAIDMRARSSFWLVTISQHNSRHWSPFVTNHSAASLVRVASSFADNASSTMSIAWISSCRNAWRLIAGGKRSPAGAKPFNFAPRLWKPAAQAPDHRALRVRASRSTDRLYCPTNLPISATVKPSNYACH